MSRWRTILVAALVIGLAYGLLSAAMNQNPCYDVGGKLTVPETRQNLAWHWRPSVVWLPSYLMCVAPINGWGIEYTRSGYLFRSEGGRCLYFAFSACVGAALGALAAWIARLLLCRSKPSNPGVEADPDA